MEQPIVRCSLEMPTLNHELLSLMIITGFSYNMYIYMLGKQFSICAKVDDIESLERQFSRCLSSVSERMKHVRIVTCSRLNSQITDAVVSFVCTLINSPESGNVLLPEIQLSPSFLIICDYVVT